MSPEEIDAFLGDHETGVISLARSDEPYAIPISYGYDASERQFHVRLVSVPDSEKRRFLASEPEARLVVHADEDDHYRSVIAVGTLARVDPDELTVGDIEQYGDASRPLFEVWPIEKRDLDIELYRLDPDSLSGRVVTLAGET
jgi:nitroimidazol reductase NimA-like FMN-containing flavoprotein (pyridoxamine 5'-phosphate oxidase superfamily)